MIVFLTYDDGRTTRHNADDLIERELSPRLDQMVPAREVVHGMTLVLGGRTRPKVTEVRREEGSLLICETCSGLGWLDNQQAEEMRSGDGTCPTCMGWGNVKHVVTAAESPTVAEVLRLLVEYATGAGHDREVCTCRVCRTYRYIREERHGETQSGG